MTQWSRPGRVLSEIMRGSKVPLRDAVPADSPGHGHARNDGRRVIRGNGLLPLITGRLPCENGARGNLTPAHYLR